MSARVPKAARDPMRRAWFEVKSVVAEYPRPALWIARHRHGWPVGDDTQIVIEGFPRSATTFAEVAFRQAQPAPVEVACHVHAPAQAIEGVRRGLPVLVVMREPEDAALSFVIRNPHLSVGQALRGWLRFHGPLVRYRDRLVVATFGQVTSDLGKVTRRVNERFGTSFAEFEHTEENVRACLERIDEGYRARMEGEELERSAARPSEVREELKNRLRREYRARGLARLRTRADAVYRLLTERADG